jgi:hypothetical protein
MVTNSHAAPSETTDRRCQPPRTRRTLLPNDGHYGVPRKSIQRLEDT